MSKENGCNVLTLKPSRHGGFDIIGVDKSRVTVYKTDKLLLDAGPCPCYESNQHEWYGHCGRDKDGNKYEGICFCGAAIPRFDDGRDVYKVDENYYEGALEAAKQVGSARKSKKTRKSRKSRKGRKGSRKH